MRQPRQVGVGSRRVDDDKIVGLLDRRDRIGELGGFDRLVVIELKCRSARDTGVGRDFQIEARALDPIAPKLDVTGEALLARVEIDGGDALPDIHQGDRDMHRQGRFAGSPFFIAEHDHVRGYRPQRISGCGHDATSLTSLLSPQGPWSRVGRAQAGLTINAAAAL
jgi:hypothetical protein